MNRILHHAYVQEGEVLPNIDWATLVHAQGRDEGTGLDVWWFEYKDRRVEPPEPKHDPDRRRRTPKR